MPIGPCRGRDHATNGGENDRQAVTRSIMVNADGETVPTTGNPRSKTFGFEK